MPILQQFSGTAVAYVPAQLQHHKNGCGWVIVYYVYNPVSDKMEKKRIRVNRLHKALRNRQAFLLRCNEICCDINIRLKGGWSPFGDSENIRYYTQLDEVCRLYIEEKQKELKPNTLRSYKSFCRMFCVWCSRVVKGCKCIQFNKTLAIRYMDYIYNDRKSSARTYNNQLKLARAFFSWAVEKCYCKENPFVNIKTKREQEKKRILIPVDVRSEIKSYFEKVKPNFVIIMELVYTSLLRPVEISRVQIKQIDLENHYIYMPGDKTKNGHHRYAYLSEELCSMLSPVIKGLNPEWYLISYDYKPGALHFNSVQYVKAWGHMRDALSLPKEMQLYSLRDTGINNMLKAGIDPLTVMQAADHHDLSMTTRYANHADPNLIRTLQEKAPKF